jgi:hypothetical protein
LSNSFQEEIMSKDIKLELADEAIVSRGGLKVNFNAGGQRRYRYGEPMTVDRSGKVGLEAANDAPLAKSASKIGLERYKSERKLSQQTMVAVLFSYLASAAALSLVAGNAVKLQPHSKQMLPSAIEVCTPR